MASLLLIRTGYILALRGPYVGLLKNFNGISVAFSSARLYQDIILCHNPHLFSAVLSTLLFYNRLFLLHSLSFGLLRAE